MSVYLDLDSIKDLSDEDIFNLKISRLQGDKKGIIARTKRVPNLGVSYDTRSVRLYFQALQMFQLGYFEGVVMTCRSTAEYLASEIFYEQADIEGSEEVISKLAESLDYRRIINDILHDKNNPSPVINSAMCKLFNDLYTLGNEYVHPKQRSQGQNLEEDAYKAIEILGKLIIGFRNVFDDFDVHEGMLKKKKDGREYKRPIKMG